MVCSVLGGKTIDKTPIEFKKRKRGGKYILRSLFSETNPQKKHQ